MNKLTRVLLVLSLSFLANISVNAASFNCDKASGDFEKTVCSDSNLSTLDEQLAQTYKDARSKSSEQEQLKKSQLEWIKSTKKCASNVQCIDKAYKERIATLNSNDNQLSNTTATNTTKTKPSKEALVQGLVSHFGPSGWARCISGNMTTLGMAARGDDLDKNFLKMNDNLSTLLGAMHDSMIASGIPQTSLDSLIKSSGTQITTALDAFKLVKECTDEINTVYSDIQSTNAAQTQKPNEPQLAVNEAKKSQKKFVKGTEYNYFSKGPCGESQEVVCIDKEDAKFLCNKIRGGYTKRMVSYLASLISEKANTLLTAGDVGNFETQWNGEQCEGSISASGMWNGTSAKKTLNGYVLTFVVQDDGEVLAHWLSNVIED